METRAHEVDTVSLGRDGSVACPRCGEGAPPSPPVAAGERLARIALVGNPNTGKTTLFNRLSGLRHKTSNFPGTTLEARVGRVRLREGGESAARAGGGHDAALIDLPGVYSLELDQAEAAICRDVLAGTAAARGDVAAAPDAVCVVADATNLARNLMLAGEALRRRLPTVVAVNMIDLARRRGLHVDAARLSAALGCGVVCVSARTGEGLEALRAALASARIPTVTPPGSQEGLRRWAEALYEDAATVPEGEEAETFSDRLDHVFTHPVAGVLAFVVVMAGLFYTLFALARVPMDLIQVAFSRVGGAIGAVVPEGILRDLLVNGVVGGVSATVVFLPQICLLFFLISLLEDTGYLARAAFVMDRVLRPFGLPGHSFVPLLSSHACALPGIMATRGIPDRRERLATILVAPFMTCSARLPVYVLITTILFRDRPSLAALAFVGCYALGVAAGVTSALVARRTILRGRSRAMALELPMYKWPSLRTALMTTWDRALVFVKNAGTNILMICIALWWLGSYPRVDPPARAVELRQQADLYERGGAASPGIDAAAWPDAAAAISDPQGVAPALREEADRLERSHAKKHSFAGMLGRLIEPVFRPLGFDWQLTIGVLSSFAAREVFVSTMAIVVTGEEDKDRAGVLEAIAQARRDDHATPVFTRPVCWSLLVYYVLAMQCLPTLAVTAREAGGWKWAMLQLAWMSGVAYVAGAIVFAVMR
jgi:ferrous iron transport protein B